MPNTKPTLLSWATTGNKTAPTGAEQAAGYGDTQKPSARILNYLLNNMFSWLGYVNNLTGSDLPVSPTDTTKIDQAIANAGGMLHPQNGVVSAATNTTTGMPAFIQADAGLTLTLLATTVPVGLAFAAGMSNGKPVIKSAVISADQVAPAGWNALPASSTVYPYIERDSASGALSYGYETAAPIVSVIDPYYIPLNGSFAGVANGVTTATAFPISTAGDFDVTFNGNFVTSNAIGNTVDLSLQLLDGSNNVMAQFRVWDTSTSDANNTWTIHFNGVQQATATAGNTVDGGAQAFTFRVNRTAGVWKLYLNGVLKYTSDGATLANTALVTHKVISTSYVNSGGTNPQGNTSSTNYTISSGAVATGAFWLNPATGLGQRWSGAAWVTKQRAYPARVVTGAAAVSSVAHFPIGKLMLGGNVHAPGSSSFRAYQTTPQALSSAVNTKLNFQTVAWDVLGEYDATNYKLTVKESGEYLIGAAMGSPQSAGTTGQLMVYVNGVLFTKLACIEQGANANELVISGSATTRLNAGDVVEIYALIGLGATLYASNNQTYFWARKVG